MIIPQDKLIKVHTIDDTGQHQVYSAVRLEGCDYEMNNKGYYGYTNYRFASRYNPYSRDMCSDIFDTSAVNYIKNRYSKKSTQSLYRPTLVEENSKLYIVPNSGIPLDDVRKHYRIKRTIEDSDCIVLSPDSISFNTYWCSGIFKWDSQKFIVIVDSTDALPLLNSKNFEGFFLTNTAIKRINKEFELDLDQSYTKISNNTNSIFAESRKDKRAAFFVSLLSQTNPKDFVYTSDLTLGSNVPLTLDTLKVIASAASQRFSDQSYSALIAELSALNQTNWRQYKGTLSRFFYHYMTYGNVINDLTPSQVPIAVKPLMRECIDSRNAPFCSKEDYDMFTKWLSTETNINSKKFITRDDLNDLENITMCDTITDYYSLCIRVIPRTYEEYCKHQNIEIESEEDDDE